MNLFFIKPRNLSCALSVSHHLIHTLSSQPLIKKRMSQGERKKISQVGQWSRIWMHDLLLCCCGCCSGCCCCWRRWLLRRHSHGDHATHIELFFALRIWFLSSFHASIVRPNAINWKWIILDVCEMPLLTKKKNRKLGVKLWLLALLLYVLFSKENESLLLMPQASGVPWMSLIDSLLTRSERNNEVWDCQS